MWWQHSRCRRNRHRHNVAPLNQAFENQFVRTAWDT